jgi:hypothetical protein
MDSSSRVNNCGAQRAAAQTRVQTLDDNSALKAPRSPLPRQGDSQNAPARAPGWSHAEALHRSFGGQPAPDFCQGIPFGR